MKLQITEDVPCVEKSPVRYKKDILEIEKMMIDAIEYMKSNSKKD